MFEYAKPFKKFTVGDHYNIAQHTSYPSINNEILLYFTVLQRISCHKTFYQYFTIFYFLGIIIFAALRRKLM